MPSVNDPEFLELLDRLLTSDDTIPELEKWIESGLDVDEKVREYTYQNREWDEYHNSRVYHNESLLYLALSHGSSELIHFLVGRCLPGRKEIEFCATANSSHLSDLEYFLENRKFLEEMLKRYEGEVDYWACVNHLELFLGFGLLNLWEMVVDRRYNIPLLPIELQIVRYINGFGGFEETLLLKQAGSPSPSFERIERATNIYYRLIGVSPKDLTKKRYEEILKVI